MFVILNLALSETYLNWHPETYVPLASCLIWITTINKIPLKIAENINISYIWCYINSGKIYATETTKNIGLLSLHTFREWFYWSKSGNNQIRDMATNWGIFHIIIERHLKNLGKVHKCDIWVPHRVSVQNMHQRVCSLAIVTGAEIWCCQSMSYIWFSSEENYALNLIGYEWSGVLKTSETKPNIYVKDILYPVEQIERTSEKESLILDNSPRIYFKSDITKDQWVWSHSPFIDLNLLLHITLYYNLTKILIHSELSS